MRGSESTVFCNLESDVEEFSAIKWGAIVDLVDQINGEVIVLAMENWDDEVEEILENTFKMLQNHNALT